jgi:lipopolysaccharide transport system ATP-binding protein
MSDVVISVEGLGKKYRIRHQSAPRYVALRDVVVDKITTPVRWMRDKRRTGNGNQSAPVLPVMPTAASREDFWALKDVSFEVKQGEVVGIIGRNGAGKSTLLKILSRITEPTAGRVELEGRVSSLLEVGTGFHPELTGRENVFLNGAILGMTRAEIKKKFDEIVAFAEVEKFLDTPVKWYSSGMYVRLAFAVAAHLEPEILIVDEVLAVGDAAFQQKCLGKMEKVAGEGRSVMMVSHNMSTIQLLCGSCILMKQGQIDKTGEPSVVVGYYLSDSRPASDLNIRDWQDRSGSGEARLVRMTVSDDTCSPTSVIPFGTTVSFDLEAEVYEPLVNPCFGVVIHASSGEPILDLQSVHDGLQVGKVRGIVKIRGTCPNLNLYPGIYFLSPWITDAAVQRSIDFPRMCCSIRIVPKPGEFGDLRLDPIWGKYWARSSWTKIEIDQAGVRGTSESIS